MQILGRYKDYYDYFGKEFGIDKTITFDRTNGQMLTSGDLMDFIIWPYLEDSHYKTKRFFNILYFVLEVGYVQYLFGVYEVSINFNEFGRISDFKHGNVELLRMFNDNIHYFKTELTLEVVYAKYSYRHSGKEFFQNPNLSFKTDIGHAGERYGRFRNKEKCIIELPILEKTFIPRFIPAKDVWVNIQNYISSKYNDKTVDIIVTDVEKAVNKGFDKKTSFRNM